MIVQRIDSNTQIIYTNDRISDAKSIASELGYVKKDGEYYKTLEYMQNTSYYPKGSSHSIDSSKFVYKGVSTYIINKTYSFMINKENPQLLVDNLNKFGSTFIMKTGSNQFEGDVSLDASRNIKFSDGSTISLDASTKSDTTNLDNFIHRMSMDNGRMLYPVLKRFINTVFMFNGHKSMLTGYIKLRDYLYMIKTPSTGLFNAVKGTNAKYSLNINSSSARMSVVDVNNGIPIIELLIDGTITLNTQTGKFDPFILFTTKPISMKNQQMPFKTVQYKGVTIFITPLLFSNIETLSTLRGGINLLS